MKVLYLIDSLGYHGSARQLHLLASTLASQGVSVEVCCLGPETPWSESLRQAGVDVHVLGWTRWLDFNVYLHLRAILRAAAPDVVHVWRMPALRALAIVARDLLPRVVMSAPLPSRDKLAWWDRRLLGQVRCLAVGGAADAERCLRQGIAKPALRVIPPGISSSQPAKQVAGAGRRTITCVGNLERDAGFHHAIWAFDFLSFLYPNAHVQLVGAGSELPALRALAAGLESDAAVRFPGALANVDEVLHEAEVVWVPSQVNTGRQVVLEAMAHGRPVVASDVPSLREIIQDGVTGYLVPVGDVLQLARRTRALFENPALRQQIGAAAREYVETHFPLAAIAGRWRELYASLVA